MAITIHKGPKTINRVITIKEPGDGKAYQSHSIRVSFEVIGRTEAEDLTKAGDDSFFARVIKGWGDETGNGGFKNEDGSNLPFNAENLSAVCDIAWVNAGFVKAYFEVAYGGKSGN